MKITYFKSQAEFRKWLEKNHDKTSEAWVGFHKKSSKKTGISYPEALDEALCYGWIDGIRKSVDESSYTIRFTPRKPQSSWSAVNIKRFTELSELRLVRPPGLKAFQESDQKKTVKYSDERKGAKLDAASEKKFKAHKAAWEFFTSQAPWYQRTSIFWVMSAKQEETRLKRLAALINDSENKRRIGLQRRNKD
ncbi:YdeI/OmpD-associated family protein [bacterium]|nr:YdeI/OmpD-associated family protein [bacterium]